jgi:hypothetical protein
MPKRKRQTKKSFHYDTFYVKPTQFDLKAILEALLQDNLFKFDNLNSFDFSLLCTVAEELGIKKHNKTVHAILAAYVKKDAIAIVGKGKDTVIYVNPSWAWFGHKMDALGNEALPYTRACQNYWTIKQDWKNDEKFTTKEETKELISSFEDRFYQLERSMKVHVAVMTEMFKTGKTPPDDITVNNVEYHVNSRLEVRAKAPELPAHIVDEYPEENPF